MQKKISVIVPCYNVEQFVDRCFESLKNQTIGIGNMELIFVNDASTDGTLSKILEYERQYPDDVMVVNLEENRGLGAVRNIALSYATAPYIGCVDSDDWVEAEMFEKMVEALEEYNCDFVECDWGYFSDGNEDFKKSAFEIGEEGFYDFSNYDVKKKYIAEQLFFTSACNKVYNRRFLMEHELCFMEGKRYEDIYFCFLLILYTNSYYHISEAYYHYYQNPNGIVQQRTAPWQLDRMDVSLAFLEACLDRGLYERYKDAIDWMFLEKYYVYMIWDIWDVFTDQAYGYYLQMKKTILELIPDYKTNPFRELEFNKMDDMLLKLLDYPLDREKYEKLMGRLWEQQKGNRFDYYSNARDDIISLMKVTNEEFHVLEVGCGTGSTLKRIASIYPQAVVKGIEVQEEVAAIGAQSLDIICGDIEIMDLDYNTAYFDYIIFGDVLEHLRDPWRVLEKVRPYLKSGGRVLTSIPNIMNAEVIYKLLKGSFSYADSGILDRTHLRFFTYREIVKMFETTGYVIESVASRISGTSDTSIHSEFFNKLLAIDEVAERGQFDAFQYLVVARQETEDR